MFTSKRGFFSWLLDSRPKIRLARLEIKGSSERMTRIRERERERERERIK
jgi:hypothetical protein